MVSGVAALPLVIVWAVVNANAQEMRITNDNIVVQCLWNGEITLAN